MCEVHRLQRLLVAEFRRDAVDSLGPGDGALEEAVRATVACTADGCDEQAMPPVGPGTDDDQAPGLHGLCAWHVLEATGS